jgi:hypothetical protein
MSLDEGLDVVKAGQAIGVQIAGVTEPAGQ